VCSVPAAEPDSLALQETLTVRARETSRSAIGARVESPGDAQIANDTASVTASFTRNAGPTDLLGSWFPDADITRITPAIAEPGTVLTCHPGTDLSDVSAGGWTRNGIAITGANGWTYTVAPLDVLQSIRCYVAGTKTVETGSGWSSRSYDARVADYSQPVTPTRTIPPALVFSPAPLQPAPNGTASVETYCPQSSGGCSGTMQLALGATAAGALPSGAAATVARTGTRDLRLGRAAFRMAGGRNKAVRMRLTRLARGLVKAMRSLPVKLTVTSKAKKAGKRRRASVQTYLGTPVTRR
jgi:hypothetical protein